MKLLLVTLRKRAGSDDVSRRETIHEGDAIQIGRAVSMEIVLPDIGVDFHHADVTLEGGRLKMTAQNDGGLMVGGKAVTTADLGSDTVQIERFSFSSEPARDGADAVLVLEEAAPGAATAPARRSKRRLEDVLPSRRLLGWVFSLAILGVFLVWPMLDVLKRPAMQPGADPSAAMVVDGMARKDLPNTTPMEIAWSSGPLSQAHQMIENDCAACHERAFEMTSNNACLSCHADTQNHADITAHPAVSLENTRCASCHKEHNGGEAPVDTASVSCVNCHSNLQAVSASSKLEPITNFGSNHPAFQLALVTAVTQSPETGITADVQRVPFDPASGATENSGLKFPHSKHLAADGVRSPGGRVQLGCVDCHQPEPGGALMRPISMDRDCSGCHQMEFSAAGIKRALPHANEDEVARILTDYYIAAALEGGVEVESAPPAVKRKRRRRTEATEQAQQASLTDRERGQAIEWAKKEAIIQMDQVFGVRLCGNCHEAQKFEDKTGVERWQVQPTVLQRHWMPRARFAHKPHDVMDCTSCHDAVNSTKSSDVLMVGQETCRDCHTGVETGAVSECVTCHEYHIPGQAPMSPDHAQLFNARSEARQRAPASQ